MRVCPSAGGQHCGLPFVNSLYYSLLKGPVQKGQKLGKAAAQAYRKDYFRSKPLLRVAQTKATMEYN